MASTDAMLPSPVAPITSDDHEQAEPILKCLRIETFRVYGPDSRMSSIIVKSTTWTGNHGLPPGWPDQVAAGSRDVRPAKRLQSGWVGRILRINHQPFRRRSFVAVCSQRIGVPTVWDSGARHDDHCEVREPGVEETGR